MIEYLRQQGVSPQLLTEVEKYRAQYPWTENQLPLQEPHYRFFGKEIWEQALAALLAGENLLLAGNKAAGKNVLAENLAYVFGRYNRNISFHINMDASLMLGTDTFQRGEVVFRPGPVYQCAQEGSFGIFGWAGSSGRAFASWLKYFCPS